jgi:signal transduction histidine kinase
MIVQYNTFNIKIFGAQTLVATLWILIGSLLFVVQSTSAFFIVWITLGLSVVFGLNLIRSVRYEVEARKLLAAANEGQERFIHFLGHEVKGYLTVARNGYAAIAEGDYGPVPEQMTKMSKDALARLNTGVVTVESILKSANLKNGNVHFTFAPFDLSAAIRKRIDMAQELLEQRGLSVTVDLPETPCVIEGDEDNMTNHAIRNLVENAIFYTPTGNIHISLTCDSKVARFAVKDTGVGITEKDKKRLFTEGGHGAESAKLNVHSTGHGLFITKNIVEAHRGRVWAESKGAGQGTTFFVELPVTQPKG